MKPAATKSDLDHLCRSNGFHLKESPLEGRLLIVLVNPKIIIKNSLDEESKKTLVKKAISYLLNRTDSQLAIFWKGREQFFSL